VNPVKTMIGMAHARGVPVLVDGAQAVPHTPVDVQDLGCEFYAISGHKMFGPTGIGALWGKAEWLKKLPPYQGGGDMISSVSFEKTTYNELPWKFEAGTANIAGGVGLGATVDYLEAIGMDRIAAYEAELLAYATEKLSAVPTLSILGTAKEKASVISFTLGEIHPHDIGTILDQEGIAIRTGHHCAQPVMDRYGVPATARVSLAFYNTKSEIDACVAGLAKVREMMG
jgi:cysteine desulfurase/selenocysteine lyase